MNIVQLIPDFGLGGIQKGGCILGKAMAAKGDDVTVIGMGPGPRYQAGSDPRLTHRIVDPSPASAFEAIRGARPEVVHLHSNHFLDDLVILLARADWRPLVVSTPVFGRLPSSMQLLDATRVCLVGTYTFYRFCRWANLSLAEALAKGIAYAPITPFEPPDNPVSALDAQPVIDERRRRLGIPENAMVVGRLARNDPGKWDRQNVELINALLERIPQAAWVSIGYPERLGRAELQRRWGQRFLDQPETRDYRRLMDIVSSFDIQAFFGRGECFASSIAEASGAAVPTVALANPLKDNGQSEQVIDGLTGYLVASASQAVDRISELAAAPARLNEMKVQTRRHCWERWHMDRVSADLLSLYSHWRDPGNNSCDYLSLIEKEATEFSQHYHDRMIHIFARGPAQRMKWRALLSAAESPTLWPIGRAVKRLAAKLRR
jgi:glycosyltransferase involved in cell wall biosynthesis